MRILIAALVLLVVGCTEQERAKSFGGEMTIKLEACEKLVNATWKESELWYITRPMEEAEKPVTFIFREDSSFDIMEGKVLFVESCKR